MSLLMNALRTALGAARGPGELPTMPTVELADDAEDAEHGAEGTPAKPPAWRLLAAQTGVQDLAYADLPRPGVERLFARPPRRVLDIGCASGAVGAGLKQSHPGAWVWGCELNEHTARIAATRLDHVTTVAREQWNDSDLALLQTVDTVLLLDVLEHMYNPWAELEFLAQTLPQEAQVIVSLPNIGHINVMAALSVGQFPYAALGILDVTHVRFFTFMEMLAMFDQTGFRVEETWVLSRSPNVQIERFPAQVAAGKLLVNVDSAEEWERLNAVQFGFRLGCKTRG
jgi:2-polyprenyl-3-methyl-5-hydroxy-6-metoxy-1,4-benzoquinol methylase